MSGVATAIAVTGAVGAYTASQAGKGGGSAKPISVASADAAARKYSEKNIQDAIRLEQQYSPETYALRKEGTQALLDESRKPTQTAYLQNSLRERYDQGFAPSALTQGAYDRALADLNAGGSIPLEVRNAVTRGALGSSAGATGNLGLGRDLAARDLGLTSMQLRNQRLQQAQNIGSAWDQNILAQLQAQQGLAAGINDLGQADLSRRLAIAQFGQSIDRPSSGLSSSDVVNLMVGNSNAQQAASANAATNRAQFNQGLLTLGGQLGGAAIGYAGSRPASTGSYAYRDNATLPAGYG